CPRALSRPRARWAPSPRRSRRRSRAPQVPVEPVERATKCIDAVLRRAETVSLAGIHVVLVGLPAVLERFHDLLGFVPRNARVVLALEDEDGRTDLRCVSERRPLTVKIRVLCRIAELAQQILAE